MAVTSPWGLPLVDDTVQITPIQNFFNAISNAMNTALTTVNNSAQSAGYKKFTTRALMTAAPGSLGDHAVVTADSAASNNIDWKWSGSAWIQANNFFASYIGVFTDNTAVAANSNHNTNISFPAGKFTQPPAVFILGQNGRFTYAASSVTATSAVVSASNWSSGPGTPGQVSFLAVQALPGSTVG